MKITLSPQVSSKSLVVSKAGDVLTINGTEYDFTVIPDGATLPADAVDCEFVIGEVERISGDLQLTLLLPITSSASHAACFPDPIVDPADGSVELPK
jgi:hypothetical protein